MEGMIYSHAKSISDFIVTC